MDIDQVPQGWRRRKLQQGASLGRSLLEQGQELAVPLVRPARDGPGTLAQDSPVGHHPGDRDLLPQRRRAHPGHMPVAAARPPVQADLLTETVQDALPARTVTAISLSPISSQLTLRRLQDAALLDVLVWVSHRALLIKGDLMGTYCNEIMWSAER
jgi:hypothetical protein